MANRPEDEDYWDKSWMATDKVVPIKAASREREWIDRDIGETIRGALDFVDAFDFDEASIPRRPWIVPGAMLAGATHILAAPGGTGKSLFTLQLALMLASGGDWGRWRVGRKHRVLIINAEDDIDEQHRRMAAARRVMGIDTGELRGAVMTARNPSSILVASLDKTGKITSATPLVAELQEVIRTNQIDVIIVDPFAETFDGDENSNNDGKWAMKIWRDDIARKTGAAVYLVHHTTKGSGDKAGSADVIRGGGALVNSARLAATLFVMTAGEASAMGVPDDQRFRYVRYDDAKSNNSLIGSRQWFEKISVTLDNGIAGETETPGDEVGALMPWEPNGIAGYPADRVMPMLAAIDRGYIDEAGVVTDLPFGRSSAGNSKRWVGYVVSEYLEIDDEKSRLIIGGLLGKGVLEEYEYEDLNKSRISKGLRSNMAVARSIFEKK